MHEDDDYLGLEAQSLKHIKRIATVSRAMVERGQGERVACMAEESLQAWFEILHSVDERRARVKAARLTFRHTPDPLCQSDFGVLQFPAGTAG